MCTTKGEIVGRNIIALKWMESQELKPIEIISFKFWPRPLLSLCVLPLTGVP